MPSGKCCTQRLTRQPKKQTAISADKELFQGLKIWRKQKVGKTKNKSEKIKTRKNKKLKVKKVEK
jgi:hypothetical protein